MQNMPIASAVFLKMSHMTSDQEIIYPQSLAVMEVKGSQHNLVFSLRSNPINNIDNQIYSSVSGSSIKI